MYSRLDVDINLVIKKDLSLSRVFLHGINNGVQILNLFFMDSVN